MRRRSYNDRKEPIVKSHWYSGLCLLLAVSTSCSAAIAQPLSASTACKMAQQSFAQLAPSRAQASTPYCPGDHTQHFIGCTNFRSDSSRGWAEIDALYTARGCYASETHMPGYYAFTFQHYDQGWQITTYVDHMGSP